MAKNWPNGLNYQIFIISVTTFLKNVKNSLLQTPASKETPKEPVKTKIAGLVRVILTQKYAYIGVFTFEIIL